MNSPFVQLEQWVAFGPKHSKHVESQIPQRCFVVFLLKKTYLPKPHLRGVHVWECFKNVELV